MEEWLHGVALHVALAIEGAAILVIAYGSAEALYHIVRFLPVGTSDSHKRQIWMRFAQWLVAGLTFQVAADVVNTTVAPNWTEIGQLAAIAAIRTFLTHFLDSDMQRVRKAESSGSAIMTTKREAMVEPAINTRTALRGDDA